MTYFLTILLSICLPFYDFTQKEANFLPKGYQLFKKVYGDLNQDGLKDCILLIKATDKSRFEQNGTRGLLDRNRRGLIILFKDKAKGYRLGASNYTCFSSENEDGGVYYPPELDVSVEKGKLLIHYAHGRYGYWQYIFRYKSGVFELIGYDNSDNYGPVTNSQTSINFLTRKKKVLNNINKDAANEEDEVFRESWETIHATKLVKLTDIKDFDEFRIPE